MNKNVLSIIAALMLPAAASAVDVVPNPVSLVETGKTVSVKKAEKVSRSVDADMDHEAYTLSVSPSGVKMTGGSETALYWAEQTLRQVMMQGSDGRIPCVEIKDGPAFPYRGMLIDCSRHFLSVDDVKRCIDMMSLHKLNKLHWHLTDDQGWRLEIKKYPELTAIGSVRAQTKIGHYLDGTQGYDGTPYGGYYTQDEVRDILAYASEHHVEVIPEIEMPGHSQELLAAFPQFGCRGEGYKVRETWHISDDPMCIGNPDLIPFLKDILDEVCDLFPGEYVNIGGDEVKTERWHECPKCQAFMKEHGMTCEQQLQRYLVGEIEKYLLSKGKKMIGWGEIFEGCSDPSTTVLSWRGTETGIKAAKKGMHSVMCPGHWMYLDYYQTPQTYRREPLAIHRNWYTTLSKVYGYDPLEGVPGNKREYVDGVQGNLWGEYIPDQAGLEHMALPRLAAVAEVAWSGNRKTDFEDFRSRVAKVLLPRYEERGYNYARYEFEEPAPASDTLRILCIGNSFSNDAVNQHLGEIVRADGRAVVVGNLYIGGCSLATHWKNMTEDLPAYTYFKRCGTEKLTSVKEYRLSDAITDEQWDVVTLQQRSGHSGLPETYEPYLGDLVKYVRNHTKARLMWHQTWSYASGATHEDFPIYDNDCSGMFRAIASASESACRKYGMDIIPSGAAIQALRSTYLNNHLNRDGYHLNELGRYVAAASFYAAIAKHRAIGDNVYRPAGIDPASISLAQRAVAMALAKPYEINVFHGLSVNDTNGDDLHDEAGVKPYTLPDALVSSDGKKIRTARQWMNSRRPELLALFDEYEYGSAPGRPEGMEFELLKEVKGVFGGLGDLREVKIKYAADKKAYFVLLEILPAGARSDVPMFLNLNFCGNYGCFDEEAVSAPSKEDLRKYGQASFMRGRGSQKSRYPMEMILGAGFGLATVFYVDICPDADTGRTCGPFRYFDGSYSWGALSAWAWGLSRCIDYLETDSRVDADRIAVVGHSRLGKASLLAGARDERIALTISSCSGCCGAAVARRCFGEDLNDLSLDQPHWFSPRFHQYRYREADFPVDQHELLSLIAPRALYVSSGSLDLQADPDGEKLSVELAGKVYSLFGRKGEGKTGYHRHEGPHGIFEEDWRQYIDFAKKVLY